jgi:very-short-patch-repair endonuclease
MKTFARQLRRNLTDAEKRLWQELRMHQMLGLRFRRQHPIGRYIVDFVCLEKKLIIELDGGQHAESICDQDRDQWLRERGYNVKRFWNNEIFENIEGVKEKIVEALNPPPPSSPSRGEEV